MAKKREHRQSGYFPPEEGIDWIGTITLGLVILIAFLSGAIFFLRLGEGGAM